MSSVQPLKFQAKINLKIWVHWYLTAVSSILGNKECVFPENIQTSTTEGIGNCGGVGGQWVRKPRRGEGF